MTDKILKKIHIIGSVGSGKTTLARKISSQLNLPCYELDNVVWRRAKPEDIRRSDDESEEYLKTIVEADSWIIEGVHHYPWVFQSLQHADLIIFLDTDYSQRTYRIIKRFMLQVMRLEKANYKPTLHMFKKMFEWNTYFEKISKPHILNILKQYEDKVIVIKDSEVFINDIAIKYDKKTLGTV